MKKPLLVPSIIVAVFLITSHASAAPTSATIEGAFANSQKLLSLTITPTGSAVDCTVSVYGAESEAKLVEPFDQAILVAEISGEENAMEIAGNNLGSVQGKGFRSVFFAARFVCGDTAIVSNTLSLRLRRREGGSIKSARAWVRHLANRVVASSIRFARAFSNLSFEQPIDFQAAPQSDRLFVVQQTGTVRQFENSSNVQDTTKFLDISGRIESGGEQGLLGMAFHPNYPQKPYIYVNYTAKGDGHTVIARYTVNQPAGLPSADEDSEQILLTVSQPFSNHNGGQVQFGGDGFLYIALGDGGSGGDPFEHGQNRSSLLGKLLRIDVDNPRAGKNYGIPGSNPFAGNTKGYREEIFAYGFRNPWRFSFDRLTDELWLNDVGQSRKEEVDLVVRGGNYGWNTMEGTLCFDPTNGCNRSGLKLPVLDYGRDKGESTTGGYVYRGSRIQPLRGFYIYADFISGRIWALKKIGKRVVNIELTDSEYLISSFGLDRAGEIYFFDYGSGAIYTLAGR